MILRFLSVVINYGVAIWVEITLLSVCLNILEKRWSMVYSSFWFFQRIKDVPRKFSQSWWFSEMNKKISEAPLNGEPTKLVIIVKRVQSDLFIAAYRTFLYQLRLSISVERESPSERSPTLLPHPKRLVCTCQALELAPKNEFRKRKWRRGGHFIHLGDQRYFGRS